MSKKVKVPMDNAALQRIKAAESNKTKNTEKNGKFIARAKAALDQKTT